MMDHFRYSYITLKKLPLGNGSEVATQEIPKNVIFFMACNRERKKFCSFKIHFATSQCSKEHISSKFSGFDILKDKNVSIIISKSWK